MNYTNDVSISSEGKNDILHLSVRQNICHWGLQHRLLDQIICSESSEDKARSLDYKFSIMGINIVSGRAVTFFIFCLVFFEIFFHFSWKKFQWLFNHYSKSKLFYHESHYNNMKTPNLYWDAWFDNIKFQITYGISIWVTENMRLTSFSVANFPTTYQHLTN